MSGTPLIAAIAGGAVVVVLLAFLWQRRRLARRFARRISPYEKPRVIGGQVLDPEEWTRR